jgi:predicted homoserine dehydrogenase-like protein
MALLSSKSGVRAGLIGIGEFGMTLLAQARRIPGFSVPVLCDLDAAKATATFADAGLDPADLVTCESQGAAEAALARGQSVLVTDRALVFALPVDVVVEATGDPEVAAQNALLAIEAGRHVVMVSKEADGVVGPILAHKARAAGLVHTPVDGDQPSLLIRLVEWARGLGLEITAAGKSSEYDFVLDPDGETVTANRRTVAAPGFAALWSLAEGERAEGLARRAAALAGLPQRTVPDFCEMGIVANATGLAPDVAHFHAPVMRTVEVADVFCPQANGGLLGRGEGVIDVFNCLRRADEASFAGGVFVVVRCHHRRTFELLRDKGHVVSRDGAHAMIYRPSHLLGVEAPRSIVAAAGLKRATSAIPPRPVVDVVGRARRPLAAGARLTLGERHTIAGLEPLMIEAGPVSPERPLPYYMAAGCRLARDVAEGEVVTRAVVEAPAQSALWRLRAEQDALFFPDPAIR